MPTITEVREALADVIGTAVPELICYATVADVAQVPAVVIRPDRCEYVVGGGSCQEWMYSVTVMVGRTESGVNQNQLDSYITTTGSKSIPAALRASPGLGLTGVDAILVDMRGYGGNWETARIQHVGAQLNVRVLITE